MESTLNVKDELENISTQLGSLSQLKQQMENINGKLRNQLTEMEEKQNSLYTTFNERITTLEVSYDRYLKTTGEHLSN